MSQYRCVLCGHLLDWEAGFYTIDPEDEEPFRSACCYQCGEKLAAHSRPAAPPKEEGGRET